MPFKSIAQLQLCIRQYLKGNSPTWDCAEWLAHNISEEKFRMIPFKKGEKQLYDAKEAYIKSYANEVNKLRGKIKSKDRDAFEKRVKNLGSVLSKSELANSQG